MIEFSNFYYFLNLHLPLMWDILILVSSVSTGHVISAFKETEVLQHFFYGTSTWGRSVLPIIMHHFSKDIFSLSSPSPKLFSGPLSAAGPRCAPASKILSVGARLASHVWPRQKRNPAKRTFKCKSWKRAATREQSGRKEQENRSKIVLYLTANCV